MVESMVERMACFCCDRELPSNAFLEWEPGLCVICLRVDQWLDRVQLRNSFERVNGHDLLSSAQSAGGAL